MYNKFIIIGNLSKDINFRFLDNGMALAKSSIASNYKYTLNGTTKEEVCFIDFDIFGKTAEIANKYLHKGSKVMLEGRIALDSWISNDGVKKSKHTLKVDNMKMLGNFNQKKEAINPTHNLDITDDIDNCPF